jgi:hypothetical protein
LTIEVEAGVDVVLDVMRWWDTRPVAATVTSRLE